MMQQIFVYGKETISYSVLFSARWTLGIKVCPSGEVVLLAPEGTPEEVIEQKLRKRAPWILRQQAYFKDFGVRSPEKRYVSGESHYYLGKQFLLRVTAGKVNSVRYKGRCFEVVCTSPDKVRELMKSWYREHAKLKFAEYAEPIITRFARYGVTPASLYVQEMENRWGSCTPKGKIILNTELIKRRAPALNMLLRMRCVICCIPTIPQLSFPCSKPRCPTGGVGKTSWSDS